MIEDGSHKSNDQITSFEKLWPSIKYNGIYLVKDTHSIYWPDLVEDIEMKLVL